MSNLAGDGRASREKKFCLQVLLFNVDATILQMLDNCAPFVEKIYATWSEYPWKYNPEAREKYRNPTHPEIIDSSKWRKKIELIRGDWDTEEAQRNAALDRARADHMDYMIIQDADEFYTPEAFHDNLKGILRNPDYSWYSVPWCSYWKTIDWCVTGSNGSITVGHPQFALNCTDPSVRFTHCRGLSGESGAYALKGLCHHLSCVLSDDQMLIKINTWGHSAQFDLQKWYSKKWLRWNPQTRNLHPVTPRAWSGTVPSPENRPSQLREISVPQPSIVRRTLLDAAMELTQESFDPVRVKKRARRAAKRLLEAFRYAVHSIGNVRAYFHRLVAHFSWHSRAKACKRRNGGSLVLHLGCGSSRKPDMLNCEIRSTPAVDVVMDCSDLSRFRTNSVQAIYSHAFFEHIYVDTRIPMLTDSARVLSNDGCLVFLGLPDFRVVAQSYLDGTRLVEGRPFDLHMVYRYTHGAPESTGPQWWMAQLHKGLLDRATLRDLVLAAGFGGGVLFNYRYPGEDVPLNAGIVAWKALKPAGFSLAAIVEPFSECIWCVDDVISSAQHF